MKFRFCVVLLFALLTTLPAFALETQDIGFPFKGFIYQSMGIKQAEVSNITTTKETTFIWEFTYQGKKYRAELFTYGAIYFQREGQNPLLLSFDIRDYRFNSQTFKLFQ